MAAPAAPSLLLLLAGAAGLSRAFFSLPLRVSQPASPRASPPAPLPLRPGSAGGGQRDAQDEAGGLALASDPAGSLNFLAMVENLQGDSGRGYYLEMLIGTPPQAVGERREGSGERCGGEPGESKHLGSRAPPRSLQRNFVPMPGTAQLCS